MKIRCLPLCLLLAVSIALALPSVAQQANDTTPTAPEVAVPDTNPSFLHQSDSLARTVQIDLDKQVRAALWAAKAEMTRAKAEMNRANAEMVKAYAKMAIDREAVRRQVDLAMKETMKASEIDKAQKDIQRQVQEQLRQQLRQNQEILRKANEQTREAIRRNLRAADSIRRSVGQPI